MSSARIIVADARLIGLRDAEGFWVKPYATRTMPLWRENPLATQIEHFAAVICGEAGPLVSARDGLQNLRVAEAISKAAPSGRLISTLDEPASVDAVPRSA